MILRANPEFASELVCIIPYAYWLHKEDKLEKVITSTGMKSFYYFCDDVEEQYDFRTLDNLNSGLNEVPNNWVHHNAEAVTGRDYSELTEEEQNNMNGVLDYREWTPPPYLEYYKTDEFNFETEKQNFVQNLDMLKSMSVQESTLYKKWQEFNKDEYKMRTKAHKFDIIKSKLWKPTDIFNYDLTVSEIEALDPIVEFLSLIHI